MLHTCPACNKPFMATGDSSTCPHCAGQGVRSKEPSQGGGERHKRAAPSGPPPSLKDGRPLFEDRELPFTKRFFPVLIDVLLRPRRFFAHLSKEAVSNITLFAYLCVFASHFFYAAYGFALLPVVEAMNAQSSAQLQKVDFEQLQAARSDPELAPLVDFMEGLRDFYADTDAVIAQLKPRLWISLLTAPITALMAIHLLAGLLHLLLAWTRRDQPWPYEVTYRSVVYAQAPLFLGLIPAASVIATVWFLVVLVIAMKQLYNLRFFGVVFGVLLPTFLLAALWSSAVSVGAERLAERWSQPASSATP